MDDAKVQNWIPSQGVELRKEEAGGGIGTHSFSIMPVGGTQSLRCFYNAQSIFAIQGELETLN